MVIEVAEKAHNQRNRQLQGRCQIEIVWLRFWSLGLPFHLALQYRIPINLRFAGLLKRFPC